MTLRPGTRIGAYEILTLIGSGGMGEVYRAREWSIQGVEKADENRRSCGDRLTIRN